jgi:hypothetical protein
MDCHGLLLLSQLFSVLIALLFAFDIPLLHALLSPASYQHCHCLIQDKHRIDSIGTFLHTPNLACISRFYLIIIAVYPVVYLSSILHTMYSTTKHSLTAAVSSSTSSSLSVSLHRILRIYCQEKGVPPFHHLKLMSSHDTAPSQLTFLIFGRTEPVLFGSRPHIHLHATMPRE